MANKPKWTKDQLKAITEHDKDVLVTASAGTGKTAVLSGRCVDILADNRKKVRPDISNLLVLTFTEAAAEEMRKRIGDELKKAWEQNKDPHIRHQMILLQAADIGTIHSFCKKIITENFYRLGIDPTFRVIDEDEQKLLKAEALEKTIDWAWEQSNLQQELAELLGGRDLKADDGFLSKIIRISDFLDGIVSADDWLSRAGVLTEKIKPFETDLGERQKQIILKKLQGAVEQIELAKEFYIRQAKGKGFEKYENDILRPFEEFIELIQANKWDKFIEKLLSFEKPRVLKLKDKDVEEEHAEFIAEMIKGARDCVDELKEMAIVNPDYASHLGASVGRQTRVMVELVRKFDEIYNQAKQAINSMDFADLEHYALKLLSAEKLKPSETALALQRKYKYIFVDEYQDINQVQKNILSLLSSGDNIFVVGDVKQSIYAFRGTTPEIFIKQLEEAEPVPAGRKLRVDLNENFRSDERILDFINSVFERIMTKEFAGIDYDEPARLKASSNSPSAKAVDKGFSVELHIIDEQEKENTQKEDEEEENEEEFVADLQQRQGALIAKRIRKMVGAEGGKAEFEIFDKSVEKRRGVEYRDIAILMRSPAERVKKYVEVLQSAGVPVSCKEAGGYFEATEISDMLCLLKVLDNPQRDIELAAVLRSPLFKVSDSELAEIKILGNSREIGDGFYEYVDEYIKNGDDGKIREKIQNTIGRLEQWRTFGRRGSLADLIWQIYRETDYPAFVSALPSGRQRRANLLKLHDRAIQFEDFASSKGLASLGRFIEFIEKMQSAGGDWTSAEPQAETENAVRIISVHKSKGLEFPVVFAAALNSGFNRQDYSQECVFDAEYTLGLQVVDRASSSKLKSLAHQVITEEKFARNLAEEMRILYVAMTRARERLILVGSEKKGRCQSIIRRGFYIGEKTIPAWQLRNCGNHLEWLLYGLSSQKMLHEAFGTGIETASKKDEFFCCKVHSQQEMDELAKYIVKEKPAAGKVEPSKTPKAEKELLGKIKESINWRYGFENAVELAAKWSVTELTHRDDENYRVDYSHALEKRPVAICQMDAGAVNIVDRLAIGTATHLVFAKLDINMPISKDAIEKTKEKLLQAGAISKEIAEGLNIDSILRFFDSKLGKEAINPQNKCYREWQFSFGIDAAEYIDDINADNNLKVSRQKEIIVVQGIIDMLIETKDGLIVIDYKTDDIPASQTKNRAEFYKQQIGFYGKAAEAILKKKLLGKWLYFLEPACAVEI